MWRVVYGDFSGHIGKNADEYEGVHGSRGFGRRNVEGERILEFAVAHNLVVSKSLFTKRENHLEINDTPGGQVDDVWSRLKQDLLSATEKTCRWTEKGIRRKQTWWRNEKVSKDIPEKRRLWMLWKVGDK